MIKEAVLPSSMNEQKSAMIYGNTEVELHKDFAIDAIQYTSMIEEQFMRQ